MSTAARQAAPAKGRQRQAPKLRPVPPATRPRRSLAFWVFAAALLGLLILGLVSLNALLAQNSFRIADLTNTVDRLSQEHDERVLEAARLSADSRIVEEARALGMTLPDRTEILKIPGGRRAHEAVGARP